MNIIEQKQTLRQLYRSKRKQLSSVYAHTAAESLLQNFIRNVDLQTGSVISGYTPIDGEINVTPIMEYYNSNGYKVTTPIIDKVSGILKFQAWPNLSQSNFYVPNIILVPLIAFNINLHRLGFGQGWYDKTINSLLTHDCKFIGVAYDIQICHNLPVEAHDQKLDMIITENNIFS